MGDDTWMRLFPTAMQTTLPYPSFNVKDLDTVDDAVWEVRSPPLNKGLGLHCVGACAAASPALLSAL